MGTITSFTVDAETLRAGESTTLRWASANADACTLTPGAQSLPASGTLPITPTADTLYRLTCAGASKTLSVHVSEGGSIDAFTASATTVAPDTQVTLRWSSTNTSGCQLNPGLGAVSATGTRAVLLTQTTTFALTCTTPFMPVTASVTVTAVPVTSLEVPTDVVVTPLDGFIEVRWSQGPGSANVYFAAQRGITASNVTTLTDGAVFRRVQSPFRIGGLVNGTPVSVRVSAVSGAVTSDLSAEQTVTPVAGAPLGDPLFADQWHLDSAASPSNVDVVSVWAQQLKGEGVKVAVTDEGIDLDHEDLRANVATGKSKDYLGNAAVALAEHGTCVAGLVGARDDNGVGGRGVAPHVQLRSFNVLQDLTSANQLDAMRRDKDVVGVNTNSWGEADNTGLLTAPDPLWLQGVTEGATTGRGGKGILYFWAAGNGADPRFGPSDNANFDSQANSRFTFAVGGLGFNDRRPVYAEAGANVLIVTPTEGDDNKALTTTDITGDDGYNRTGDARDYQDRSYTRFFNGTSAATPIAAGIGALLLQARPELSYRDVRRVLAKSARKCDPMNGGWATTAAGLHVNHEYGFGLADAKDAVALARTIELVGPEVTFSAPWTPAALPIPDLGEAVRSSLTVSNSGIGHIEFIEIEVDVDHANSGDVEITLERPGSVSDLLHPTHNCGTACSDIDHFVFGSVRHLDEAADGTWTLAVKDRRSGTVGTFAGWTIRIYGRQ